MDHPPILLKATEAARTLNVSRSKLYELMAAGSLPGVVKIGRSVRISRSALERWVRDQIAEPASGITDDRPTA